ncbi:MAG: General secretion pathway protein L [Burkholderiaceae bacterium]|jgi:general secretion pathway protein L|nr:MAG: General secretion pathway protein L [Burkholderiaceae bacterium]
MATLIVHLPSEPVVATTRLEYVLASDRHAQSGSAGTAPAALLPQAAGGELVAIVPPALLSWHRITLPPGNIGSPSRLRAVLEGLLEERLLDDPGTLHFALEPQARAGASAWVAACDKNWLRSALTVLEVAGRPVARIVPEFAPELATSARPVWHAIGTPEQAQLVLTGAGVTLLPLTRAGTALAAGAAGAAGALDAAPDAVRLVAEPAVAELAEHLLQRPVALEAGAQRWLRAAASPWDLAQFDFASSGRSRVAKRLVGFWQTAAHAPQWRAARWGLGLLLLAQIVGLNAWAWHERAGLERVRGLIRATLTQTFPDVRVVVDAPLQMAREVDALRQATGAASDRDLEAMLGALSAAVPAGRRVAAIEFAPGELSVKGLQLSTAELAAATGKLQARGYRASGDGTALTIRQGMAR